MDAVTVRILIPEDERDGMYPLKRVLKALNVTYVDIAKQAGKLPPAVRMYFSQSKGLGPGPQWVEDALRAALLEAGVNTADAEELVAGWKRERVRLNSNTQDSEPITP